MFGLVKNTALVQINPPDLPEEQSHKIYLLFVWDEIERQSRFSAFSCDCVAAASLSAASSQVNKYNIITEIH